MDILKVVKERRSIRAFKDKPIPKEAIDKLIDALIWAPSAGNLQSRHFYFVFNNEVKRAIVKTALGQGFIAEAPLCVVACTDDRIAWRYGKRGTELYSKLDVAASIQNLMLVAHSLGLGSCWVGAFDEEGVRRLLNIPEGLRPVALVPVGYPAEKPSPPSRVSAREAITFVE